MAKGDVCRTCQGFGEAMVLSNPSDPEDGSYEMHTCPRCGGTGLEQEMIRVKNKVHFDKKPGVDALRSAIDAMETAFKQSRPRGRNPSDRSE